MENPKCMYCKTEMPAGAKVCPHCRSWQSKFFPGQQSPRGMLVAMVSVVIIFGLFFLITQLVIKKGIESKNDDKTEKVDLYRNLKIAESELMVYRCGDNTSCVEIQGTVENPTKTRFEDPYLHADVFNREGKRVDTIYDRDWDLVIHPKSKTTFQLRGGLITTDPAEYASHKISIRWAKEMK